MNVTMETGSLTSDFGDCVSHFYGIVARKPYEREKAFLERVNRDYRNRAFFSYKPKYEKCNAEIVDLGKDLFGKRMLFQFLNMDKIKRQGIHYGYIRQND